MHSNIIQLSKQPIDREEWATPEQFYDNSGDFADYIGDYKDDETRKEIIAWMASDEFGGIFSLEGDHLVFNGLGDFLRDWYTCIKVTAAELNHNEFDSMKLFKVKQAVKQTHCGVCSRFYIENWDGYAAPMEDLIGFCKSQLNEGDKVYVGAIIDYHF